MDRSNIIECEGFYFIHKFDSGNLGHVENIYPVTNRTPSEVLNYEFNLWTRPDCAGTEFENGNRTWFYFGVQAPEPNLQVRFNLINLNKQGKMYNQGMAPVTRTLPGKPQWERIRDRPIHSTDDNTFTLSFKFRTPENLKATTFFAFTYPYSFAELQIALNSIDMRLLPLPQPHTLDDIYYHRECLIFSLEGRRVDLLTITSHHGICTEREERLKNLFPDNQPRPFKFTGKKVIFISARVHPGETPSSFVFNGFLNLLLTRNDQIAIQLRKLYVFKMIPFLNPDGVARGHYRTDTRGVNLNRVYLNPSLAYHPTVYASRALIRYYHFGCEKEDILEDSIASRSVQDISESVELINPIKRNKSRIIRSPNKKTMNKSIMVKAEPSIKNLTETKRENSTSEASTLAEQVCDLKLQDVKCQTNDILKPSNQSTNTILSTDIIKSCLGSSLHLSPSDEINHNLQGTVNPLRPLRDTLKNSISLLMESNSSSVAGDSTDMCGPTLKIGWCRQCMASVERLEHSMPGVSGMVPGYIATMNDAEPLKAEKGDMVYFCTNCFKRYTLTESNEEISLSASIRDKEITIQATSPDKSPDLSADMSSNITVGSGDAKISQSILQDSPVSSEITIQLKKEPKPKSPASHMKKKNTTVSSIRQVKEQESGLYLYIDLHGHASKKGIFMYGNHFEDLDSSVECMLLPRIMSLNNLHFHFSSCNFTERNMYLKDRRDGMSREGSGRVAVLKATGLVRSYTLECNYNTGRLVNVLPPPVKEGHIATPIVNVPPKYNPHIYEEVGRSLGASILDLTGQHPNSRLPCSEHRNLPALRDWLRAHTRSLRPPPLMARLQSKTSSPNRLSSFARPKPKADIDRKENAFVGPKTDVDKKRVNPPLLAQRSGPEIMNINVKYAKKNEAIKTTSRTRYLGETEPKPKSLSAKRRNILAVRKPNSSKTRLDGVKSKTKRASDGTESPKVLGATKLSKRSYSRSIKGIRNPSIKIAPSSSSDDMINGNWEEVGTILGAQGGVAHAELPYSGKRRPFPNPSPSRLKKIRLKQAI